MNYKVLLLEDAVEDFRRLDGSVKKVVAKQLKKLETAPHLGEPLGSRHGLDLTGYYKIYAAHKSIRIVYRIIGQEIVVEIIGIGKRTDFETYVEAAKRVLKGK